MTRRPRRASSAPQRVGSDEGLTSSSPHATEPTEPTEPAEPIEPAEPTEPAEPSTRHTRATKVDQTKDDTDEGWGEPGDDDASARWLRENRPPHWD